MQILEFFFLLFHVLSVHVMKIYYSLDLFVAFTLSVGKYKLELIAIIHFLFEVQITTYHDSFFLSTHAKYILPPIIVLNRRQIIWFIINPFDWSFHHPVRLEEPGSEKPG